MKYSGITIGPIYKTLTYAKKTRELWAASYLFSFLMKQILKKLKDKNVEILLPYSDAVELNNGKIDILNDKYEAGLLPDRIIINSDNLDFNELNEIVDKATEFLIDKLINHLNLESERNRELKEYFNNYFQVYCIEKEFETTTLKREITENLFESLDIIELQNKFLPVERKNFMQEFLSQSSFKKGKNHSFLVEDSKTIKSHEKVKFLSLIEITAGELIEKLDLEEKEEFYKILENDKLDIDEGVVNFFKKESSVKAIFKTYHKYIAIVHIDGDRFGEINKILDDTAYKEFNKSLARFSLRIHKEIDEFGGLPVYIGGDDAMFFAPVRNKGIDIFQLIDKVDSIFNEEFNPIIEKENLKKEEDRIVPTLSAGISITYYKYPLEEALETSRGLLNKKAKKYKNKNAVSFNVQLHSGHQFEATFTKDKNNDSPYKQFKTLIKENIEDERFLSSVSQILLNNQSLLNKIAGTPDRLHAFRENFFDEDVHGIEKNRLFLNSIEKYIQCIYEEHEKDDMQIREKIFASLQMVKFLNRIDNE